MAHEYEYFTEPGILSNLNFTQLVPCAQFVKDGSYTKVIITTTP